ncbi:MAG: CGNR zinc finger domain-containing protein [Dongiaceae bacterium]
MYQQPEASKTPKSRAGRLHLLGGRLCLDFANTTSGRGGPQCLEHLHEYKHLLQWCRHAGLLSAIQASRLAHAAGQAPAKAARILRQAKRLREAIYSLGVAVNSGRSPAAGLARLNAALALAQGHRQIAASAGGFVWKWRAGPDDLGWMLGPIALSAAELLLTLDRRRLKQCAGQHCGWLFLDETRSRTRRWCDMRVCGSRAKIRRFRQRQRGRVGSAAKS